MKCSAFIAASVDGFIADKNGGIDWLQSCLDPQADMGDDADMGMSAYFDSVDCLIMGRKCMEKIASFNLSDQQWPYKGMRVIALSNSLNSVPDNIADKVELYSGDLQALLVQLEAEGFQHAYIDGGSTICEFIALGLLDEITVTQMPVLLGEGISLFAGLAQLQGQSKSLTDVWSKRYPNQVLQWRYSIQSD